MRPRTRALVGEVLQRFVEQQRPKLLGRSMDEIRQAYPFHRLIFPDEAILAARLERSIVTSMGTDLYPSLAAAISRDRFQEVGLGRVIEGAVNDAACNMIEQIVTELRAPSRGRPTRRRPDRVSEVADILASRGGGASQRSVTADLYIGDFEGGPLFIELKTPLPNLDIAAESKRKMLYFLAIMSRQNVTGAKAFLGLTYNPYLTRAKYGHSFTRRIMDMENEVLIGQELWDYIGGAGTYTELLGIIDQFKSVL